MIKLVKPAGTLDAIVSCPCGDSWNYRCVGLKEYDGGAIELLVREHKCGEPFEKYGFTPRMPFRRIIEQQEGF